MTKASPVTTIQYNTQLSEYSCVCVCASTCVPYHGAIASHAHFLSLFLMFSIFLYLCIVYLCSLFCSNLCTLTVRLACVVSHICSLLLYLSPPVFSSPPSLPLVLPPFPQATSISWTQPSQLPAMILVFMPKILSPLWLVTMRVYLSPIYHHKRSYAKSSLYPPPRLHSLTSHFLSLCARIPVALESAIQLLAIRGKGLRHVLSHTHTTAPRVFLISRLPVVGALEGQ